MESGRRGGEVIQSGLTPVPGIPKEEGTITGFLGMERFEPGVEDWEDETP